MPQQNKQLRWISIFTFLILSALMLSIIIKVNNILTDKTATKPTTHVSILTSDVIADQSWGSLAYKGQLKILERFPVTISLYAELNSTVKIEEKVKESIENDVKLIIGQGREFSPIFERFASLHPDTHFVTIHGTATQPNQTVYTFNHGHLEYFAGTTAAMKTSTNKVAMLDPIDLSNMPNYFEQGAKSINENIEFRYEVIHTRDDGKKAIASMQKLIEDGYDVFFSKGNALNRDVIDYAKDKNVYVIGYIEDQRHLGPEVVLTSIVNDIPGVYEKIVEDFLSDEGIPQGRVMLTENDNIFYLAPFGPMFSEEELEKIEHEIQKYYETGWQL
ncbi:MULTISPECIES: BMP family ABC transporter substrate-binding protein [Bacillus]|uniref:BMP family ABC transporter substrate-binding protein n=1 Tax=Bacillus TaxID=1386 RepID=UPI0012FF0A3E|nr:MULTISPECIES: BMP family ABC transporter substrate-binding protein [Bacillus]